MISYKIWNKIIDKITYTFPDNVVGKVLAEHAPEILKILDYPRADLMNMLEPYLKAENAVEVYDLKQIEVYKEMVTVQRYDIGIPQFSNKLKRRAHITFCNDVFEHIPYGELKAFIADLEKSGECIFASISLRDAVNYIPLSADEVEAGAKKADSLPEYAILLEKDANGAYIFSLHVSVLPKAKWQEILGDNWHLLPAQDYTACAATNAPFGYGYEGYKRNLIVNSGFADFISFPTPVGTAYENDPLLNMRVAKMQPLKHIIKLNALKEYSDHPYLRKEKAISEAFLKFVGLKTDAKGEYHAEEVPDGWLLKLMKLEKLSKAMLTGTEDTDTADKLVKAKAEELINEYNAGNTELFA